MIILKALILKIIYKKIVKLGFKIIFINILFL